jgi:hypothetical protein
MKKVTNHKTVSSSHPSVYHSRIPRFALSYALLADSSTLPGNGKYNITLFGTKYDIGALNIADGYCDGDLGYSVAQISQHTRCLPDTANESYRWGFSTMLSGVFTFIQLAWALSMYAVWLDAHFNSELVKSGFRMSQLRAAFLLTAAAKARTGMRCEELVSADVRDLRVKLMGSGKSKGAEVSRGMFNQDAGRVSEEEQVKGG